MESARPVKRLLFTYREFCLLPADGRRWELVEGDFHVTPAPAPFHQTVSRRLQYALMTQLEEPGIALVFNAPCDVLLEDTTVVEPDLIVLATARRELVTDRGIEGPPDLVVEILSPSSAGQDRFLKPGVYARAGIPEYWIVDPSHGWIELYRILGEKYELHTRFDRASTLRSPAFAEISIPLAPVFRPL